MPLDRRWSGRDGRTARESRGTHPVGRVPFLFADAQNHGGGHAGISGNRHIRGNGRPGGEVERRGRGGRGGGGAGGGSGDRKEEVAAPSCNQGPAPCRGTPTPTLNTPDMHIPPWLWFRIQIETRPVPLDRRWSGRDGRTARESSGTHPVGRVPFLFADAQNHGGGHAGISGNRHIRGNGRPRW